MYMYFAFYLCAVMRVVHLEQAPQVHPSRSKLVLIRYSFISTPQIVV